MAGFVVTSGKSKLMSNIYKNLLDLRDLRLYEKLVAISPQDVIPSNFLVHSRSGKGMACRIVTHHFQVVGAENQNTTCWNGCGVRPSEDIMSDL